MDDWQGYSSCSSYEEYSVMFQLWLNLKAAGKCNSLNANKQKNKEYQLCKRKM
jgi:hypothetical protein